MNSISATSMKWLVGAITGLVVAIGITVVIANRHIFQPAAEIARSEAAPAVAKPAAQPRDPLAATRQNVDELASLLAGSAPPPPSGDGSPEFDIVRIEPTGEAVIAGHAAPGATVELLRNGEPLDRAVAGQSGQFAMVPPPLPRGSYDLTLRARQPGQSEVLSRQSVAVALPAGAGGPPLVALTSPDKPTVVLSPPPAVAVAETVAVEAVDVGADGKTHVSGRARPGATVRLYLNDNFTTSATAGADGRLSVTVNEGVVPGNHRVRLDEVDAISGKVSTRAEVPFNVPDPATTASVPAQAAVSNAASDPAARPPATVVAAATPDGAAPPTPQAPEIATITVSRGDSLWHISHRALGDGHRYAVVYQSNRAQIRDPNLIYPGQVLVLPPREDAPASAARQVHERGVIRR